MTLEQKTSMRAARTILLAGIVAGTLDGLAAVAQYTMMTGKDPANVFVYVSSGVFGPSAFSGAPSRPS